MYGSLIS